ncbi:SprT-like domain-containing protein [Salinirubrum litoreum]|uniref:SprT-like domain-containing protein n=1 Tax=Salinirubrum litoreum TaxID=1126234 RepID=A0ABD5RE06_9EURY
MDRDECRAEAEAASSGDTSERAVERAGWRDGSGWPSPDSPAALRRQAAAYARTVPLGVDLDRIDWEVSRRAKRRAGACLHHRETGRQTIRLTWAAYESFGWERFAGTIRHELAHAWEFQRFDESSHGRRFRRVANRIDAPLSCPPFSEARLLLRCRNDDCDWRARRYRACPTVTRPDGRRCGDCGSRYRVFHVASGETWASADGYERARSRLGDRW